MNKRALITGINGMDGSHLADLLLKKGYEVYLMYIIQRDDCSLFKIAKDIDEEYKIAFDAPP